jgi:hypothetical protein
MHKEAKRRYMKSIGLSSCILVAVLSLFVSQPVCAQASVPASGLAAFDTPSDEGQSITVEWESASSEMILLMRGPSPEGDFEVLREVPASDQTYTDRSVQNNVAYYYRLGYPSDAETLFTAATGPAVATGNWFRTGRMNTLILTILVFVMVVSFIQVAKRGRELYIRKIAGLSAMDEAIGRATEMGRKMLYIPGILSINEIQTIASLYIMKYVAQKTATYGATLEVPNIDPLTFSAARETVKQAYMEAGKPDQYKEEMVTYITYDQFAYTASITGKMVRERPATNFLVGSFFAESLILAETGQSVGAIQIAGTAELAQLPFFVTACDYTLMGEELYAASAYLSREPVLLGSIKAQDTVKAMLMVVILVGLVTVAFGWDIVRELLTTH